MLVFCCFSDFFAMHGRLPDYGKKPEKFRYISMFQLPNKCSRVTMEKGFSTKIAFSGWRSSYNKSKSKNVFFCINSSCFFSILFFSTSFQSFPMISILFSSSFFETFAFNFQFFFPVFGSGVNQKSP